MSYYFIYLNNATYFRHVQNFKYYVCGLLVTLFMEGSVLTSMNIFSFLWFLNCTSLQITHIMSEHLIFWGSVDIGGYLVVAYFEE